MSESERKIFTPCSKKTTPIEFIEMLERFGDNVSEFFTDEAIAYFGEQIEALEEINKLEKSAREHAHVLLNVKDKEKNEFKYTPKEVLEFIAQEGN